MYKGIHFKTLSFSCLNEFHAMFYNKAKRIFLNIKYLLTPVGLAHVIMADGYFDSDKQTIFLCTENYTLDGLNLLIEVLVQKFDLKATANKRELKNGAIGWSIRFGKSSLYKLKALVFKFIIPEMMYKLGIEK